MNEIKALELIAKDLTGEISRTERSELLAWAKASEANQAFYEETKALWEASAEAETETMEVDAQLAWQQLEPKLDQSSGGRIVSIRPRFPWWRVAAAVLLLFGGLLIWQWGGSVFSPSTVEVITGTDERVEVTLPDASRVVLNEESVLRYPERFAKRRVELEGEAFFSVARDPESPFAVEANGVVTRVLGTKFTVRAYRDEPAVNVQVQEGLVAVQPGKERTKSINVSAGQGVVYQKDKRTLTPLPEADPNADAFVDQVLVFTDAPLRQVIADMSDYYGATLRLGKPGLGNCRVNIIFEGVELDEALEKLSFIANLTISRTDGTFLLDGEPCN